MSQTTSTRIYRRAPHPWLERAYSTHVRILRSVGGDRLFSSETVQICHAAIGHDYRTSRHGRAKADRTRAAPNLGSDRSEEHTSELQSLMRISYAVFCLKKKK